MTEGDIDARIEGSEGAKQIVGEGNILAERIDAMVGSVMGSGSLQANLCFLLR